MAGYFQDSFEILGFLAKDFSIFSCMTKTGLAVQILGYYGFLEQPSLSTSGLSIFD